MRSGSKKRTKSSVVLVGCHERLPRCLILSRDLLFRQALGPYLKLISIGPSGNVNTSHNFNNTHLLTGNLYSAVTQATETAAMAVSSTYSTI